MANRCGPGSVLIVHNGEMGTGFCSRIPRYFDSYVEYIDRQPTLELTDVGEYDIERLYTVLYGPLESGEYYNRKDLNGDGVTDFYKASEVDGEEQILTVYGRDDEFQKYELSYDDWLDQYGQTEDPTIRDQANQSASDLNSILGGIGNEQEISDYLYGLASGPMPEPTGTGPTVEVDVFQCLSEGGSWLDCTTLGVVLQIPGIPALPSAILGSIFREKTLREIIEDLENAADTVKEVIGDIKDIFDPNVDSKLDEKIKGILTTIKDKVKGIFDGDGSGEVTIGDIDEILKGVGGAVLTGVFGVLVETGKDAIEDTLGLPPGTLLTTDNLSSDSCFAQGFQLAGDGSDKWNCSDVEIAGQPCAGPYNSTGETDEQGNCNFVKGASCQPPNEPTGTAGEIDASGNCIAVGGDDDGDDDGVTLTTEEQICKNTGRKYDDLNDECLQECDNPEYIILGDGNCGPDPTTTGTGYSPVCTEPRPSGELTFELEEQQMMWDQQCSATHCPTGKEYDYFPEDTNKSGSFEYQGELYTYDPCDPLGKENSLTSTPIDDGGTETGDDCPGNQVKDQNGNCVDVGSWCKRSDYGLDYCVKPDTGGTVNTPYGKINANGDCECLPVESFACTDPYDRSTLEGQGDPCSGCVSGFDKPEGYTNCTSFEDLCRDQAPGYGPNDGNPACEETTGPSPCEQINPATGQPSPRDDMGECIDCEDGANALACGWVDCGDNVYAPTQSACPTVPPPPPTCNDPNAVNNGEEGDCRCKPGFSKDPETLLCVQGTVGPCENGATTESGCEECPSGQDFDEDGNCGPIVDPCDDPVYAAENPQECGYTCDDPNATILQGGLTPGACGPCKEGYVFDGTVERCVQIEQPDPCDDPEYAAANPTECGTPPSPDCSDPEYAAANPEECAPAPPPPPETGGGGGVGGGGGAFSPFMAGIDYTPQALPTPPAAPQKDYMMELDNLIKRSLFEGIV